ncbi:hypothetical protein V6N11_005314 [Hibiscus sabdariffa]|uniref:Uncharacterized protein n=1 Tax=Hibiscus sabdariffa TaxID=183260 RepID=A0ABR2RMG8_9ROSI
MVLMVPSSGFKKRDYDEDNNVVFGKKPVKLELPAPDNVSDSGGYNGVDSCAEEAEVNEAATKLQKFYKSYRTRRNLADCAVVVEELWWKALEFAALRRSSVSFFSSDKSETAVSRWARGRTRAAKVGKGLSKDVKGQQLALRHWLEAIDPRHRYGHNLHFYYDVWFESASSQPFFYWLDVGDGKAVSLDKCPRLVLHRQCIKYLGPKEREAYEVILEKGKLIYKQNKEAVNTREGSKWIFVLSTCRVLYVGEKVKGLFQHSSFLAGGATVASGRLVVHHGTPHAVWAYSGHYRPTQDNFMELCSFLEEHHVDMSNVKVTGYPHLLLPVQFQLEMIVLFIRLQKCPVDDDIPKEQKQAETSADKNTDAMHAREKERYKWSTGVGPRIGCVRDYPAHLQFKALEHVNLSPRIKPRGDPIPSPRPSPKLHLSPRLAYLGLVSPRVRGPVTQS